MSRSPAKLDAEQGSQASARHGGSDRRGWLVRMACRAQFVRPLLHGGTESRFLPTGNWRSAVDRANDFVVAVWHPQGNRPAEGAFNPVVAQRSLLGIPVEHD